jgi:hypothetical protein
LGLAVFLAFPDCVGGLFLAECVNESLESIYPNTGWATFGNLQVAGNGWDKTSDDCGKFKHIKGCLHTELHDRVTLDGKDYRGEVYVRLVHTSCYNWRCKTCHKSVAAREARNVEKRINEYVRLHGGVPEHIIISVPRSDWGLDPRVLRRKMEKVFESNGGEGGADIFHHARYANAEEAREKGVPFGWRLGFHFHIIGFLKGGYRCRGCSKLCSGCSGYEERWRKEREKSGWVIKVAMDREGNVGKRISIFWTAYYQLEHSTIQTDVKRPHPLTWWGSCSYRRLKVKVEKVKHVCPICGSELVRLIYLGREPIVKEKDASGYKAELFEDLYGSEGVRFVEAPSGCYGRSE